MCKPSEDEMIVWIAALEEDAIDGAPERGEEDEEEIRGALDEEFGALRRAEKEEEKKNAA